MKVKVLVSVLFLIIMSTFYFNGSCQWDGSVYWIGIVMAILFLGFSLIQSRQVDQLEKQLGNRKNG